MPIKTIDKNFDDRNRQIFADRLNARMQEMGYRADTLGECIGVPRRTIANYATGEVSPPITTAQKIAIVLRCDLEDLII
jgi:DNA-binding XRE family transcriptional regulator